MKGIFYTLLLASVLSAYGCHKKEEDPYKDIELTVNYPLAEVGDVLTFSLTGLPSDKTLLGVKWYMGDATPEYIDSTSVNYTYANAGEYWVTATVFYDDATRDALKKVVILQP